MLCRLFFGLVAIFLCFACSESERSSNSDLARIIGENNLERIGDSDPRQDTLRAIGQVALGCTATHLGNGIALTAGHCFSSLMVEPKIDQEIDCSSQNFAITWGKVYGFRGYLTSRCISILALKYNSSDDYAIISVEPIPSHALAVRNSLPVLGESISIFSYPRRRPLEWSGSCTVETFLTDTNAHYFTYSCDTQEGSSGAPILDAELNLLGIHTFYNDTLDRNGGEALASIPVQQYLKAQEKK